MPRAKTPCSRGAELSWTKVPSQGPERTPHAALRAREALQSLKSFRQVRCQVNWGRSQQSWRAPASAHLRKSVWWTPSPGEGQSGSRSAHSSGCGHLHSQWDCGPSSRSPGSVCEAVDTQGKKQLEADGTAGPSQTRVGLIHGCSSNHTAEPGDARAAVEEGGQGTGSPPTQHREQIVPVRSYHCPDPSPMVMGEMSLWDQSRAPNGKPSPPGR